MTLIRNHFITMFLQQSDGIKLYSRSLTYLVKASWLFGQCWSINVRVCHKIFFNPLNFHELQNVKTGVMGQQLGALVSLLEVCGSVLTTYIVAH